MSRLPSGTVTFLFTDLESSTRLWDEHPEAMRAALARHDELVRLAVVSHGGVVVKGTGDGVHAAFESARQALGAAVAAQHALDSETWHGVAPLRARMGVHSGEAELRDADYFGTTLNRAARLMSLAHGGQIVCSQTTADLTSDSLPDDVALVDLGEHLLRDLARSERVFQVWAPGLVRDFGPLRSGARTPGNLPRQATTFVGRHVEIAEMVALVKVQPLVTLTGVGGVGKTRLALEVAAAASGEFPDGAWFCELASVTDPEAVWDALAAPFRLLPSPGRRLDEVLVEYLASRRALLVLDNCEHLLDAAARVVTALGRQCGDVAVLATSREGLAVPGEQIVAVPSLPVPAPDTDLGALDQVPSVRLFCDRARAVKHDFTETTETLESVAQLCRRLDGIPLALELAAARVGALSPDDLLARLDHRFGLLTRGSRASLARQQTLRNTIDWSYDLLDDVERVALQRLSVFAGGGNLDALEAVLAGAGPLGGVDVIDSVSRLVSKSMVITEPGSDGRIRYRMLETIRQYAHERLEASDGVASVRAAHAHYFASLAEAAGPGLHSREQALWGRRLEPEIDNFRVAVDWAVEKGDADTALRLVAPLIGHGHAVGYSAGEWADTAIEIPGAEDHPAYLAVASWAVFGAAMRRDFTRGNEVAARIEAIQDRKNRRDAAAYQGLGTLAFFQNDFPRVRALAEEWVAAARDNGDRYALAYALVLLGGSYQFANEHAASRARFEEAVLVARHAGNLSALSLALAQLVNLLEDNEREARLALIDEALATATELGDQIATSVAGSARLWAAADLGDHARTLQLAQDAAKQMEGAKSYAVFIPVVAAAAISLAHSGDARRAAILFGAADSNSAGEPPNWIAKLIDEARGLVRAALPSDELAALEAQGAAMSTVDATAYVAHIATSLDA